MLVADLTIVDRLQGLLNFLTEITVLLRQIIGSRRVLRRHRCRHRPSDFPLRRGLNSTWRPEESIIIPRHLPSPPFNIHCTEELANANGDFFGLEEAEKRQSEFKFRSVHDLDPDEREEGLGAAVEEVEILEKGILLLDGD